MYLCAFKEFAKMTHDNKDNAIKKLGQCWGLGFWRDLWAYKEYTYNHKGVIYMYRVGQVYYRHGSYRHVECFIGDKEVTLYKFKKALLEINV